MRLGQRFEHSTDRGGVGVSWTTVLVPFQPFAWLGWRAFESVRCVTPMRGFPDRRTMPRGCAGLGRSALMMGSDAAFCLRGHTVGVAACVEGPGTVEHLAGRSCAVGPAGEERATCSISSSVPSGVRQAVTPALFIDPGQAGP